MSIPSTTTQWLDPNSWNLPSSDNDVIKEILLKDPWCTIPTVDQMKTYIKKWYPTLTEKDVTRISDMLKPQLEVTLAKEMIDFKL